MKVLVTGGAGYIGSTVCSALEESGHIPIVLDNLCRGKKEFVRNRMFYCGDIADKTILEKIHAEHPDLECAIHCAALIVVPESVEKPYEYYTENVAKSIEFFKYCIGLNISKIVFSSSASIYDISPQFMVTEESPLKPSSPYARTKYMMEMVLQDFCRAYKLKGIALRYFNPIGADPKMRSGIHDPNPTHVLGKMVACAQGLEPEFLITGTNWPTRDGTGIRDYVHVWDLAIAHVNAIEKFDQIFINSQESYLPINLGSGNGVTVRELVTAFEKVYGKPLPKREAPPRPGDVAGAYANTERAAKLLGWKPCLSIEQGIADALQWGKIRRSILGYD